MMGLALIEGSDFGIYTHTSDGCWHGCMNIEYHYMINV
jgi:hypothetical protein